MSKIKKIATLSLGKGINLLINFLFLPYMARVLSYNDYGSYGQTLLIVSFVGAILTFGLPQIIYIYLNDKTKNINTVLSTNLFAAVSLGLIGVLFLLLTAQFLAHWLNNILIEKLIIFYSFSLLFSIPYQSINAFLIFKNKVKLSVLVVVFSNLLKIGLVVYFIQIYGSVYLALIGIVISLFVQFCIGIFIINKSITFYIDKILFIEQLKKGFPLGLTGLLGTAILYTDGLMVSKLRGIQSYAIYRNGAIEVPFISTIYSAIATIILPEVAKLFSQNKLKEILILKRKVIMNTMMIVYPVLVFLLFNSINIIVAYLGHKYKASSLIFLVFNLTLLVRINDYSDILISANKAKYILYYYCIALMTNVILNYLLINWIGSIGAAIGTVMSIFLLAFLQLKMSLSIIKAKFADLIIIKNMLQLIISSLILAFSLNELLSYFLKSNIRLIVFFFSFFPIIYFYLLKKGLLSKEILERLLPRKLANLITKLKWV